MLWESKMYRDYIDWSTRFLCLMYINYKFFIHSIVNQDKILNGALLFLFTLSLTTIQLDRPLNVFKYLYIFIKCM